MSEKQQTKVTRSALWIALALVIIVGASGWVQEHRDTGRLDRQQKHLARNTAALEKAQRATELNRYLGCQGGVDIITRFNGKLAQIRAFIEDAARTRAETAASPTLTPAARVISRAAAKRYEAEAKALTPFKTSGLACARLKPAWYHPKKPPLPAG